MRGFKTAHGKLGQQIWGTWQRIEQLGKHRAAAPLKAPVQSVRDEPVVKLALERKHLSNLIEIVAYQAGSALPCSVTPHYWRAGQEGSTLLQSPLASAADLQVTETELASHLGAAKFAAANPCHRDALRRTQSDPHPVPRLSTKAALRHPRVS